MKFNARRLFVKKSGRHTYTTSMLLPPINIPRSVVQLAKGPKQKPAAIKWSHDWKIDVMGNRSGVKLLPSLLLTMPCNVTCILREQYTNICHNYAVNLSDWRFTRVESSVWALGAMSSRSRSQWELVVESNANFLFSTICPSFIALVAAGL